MVQEDVDYLLTAAAKSLGGIDVVTNNAESAQDNTIAAECLTALPAPISIPRSFTTVGSEQAYREESPVHEVQLDGFETEATISVFSVKRLWSANSLSLSQVRDL